MRISYERGEFTEKLNALKQKIFGSTEIVLHRTEIVRAIKPFECLKDDGLRTQFNQCLLELLESASYKVITVTIDKKEHKNRYQVWQAYPYHYCLTALLERYVLWLRGANSCGDVMIESRGEKDNRKLEASYSRLYLGGTDWVGYKAFQNRLTTRKLKIEEKARNIAGLQLSELLANPSMWLMICEKSKCEMLSPFGIQVASILKKSKYRRRYDGVIAGIGTKWLP